ncbi:SpoIID/LytB domain-containing protein [Orenia marismortui]|uniref:SpoIID/LytB domain protein n=1 Tax=Orenia marismortui TaxID=46469 RepID=A0A4V3H040_9FIRM|nr:SpoIID/LytB domain-containing protein [Orenia marismortui]TDX59279.1 SpoIID/LytB domain protein [Orenia marismortui]
MLKRIIKEQKVAILAVVIILLSFISSGIFAYYNHNNQNVDYNKDQLLSEANVLYYEGKYEASINKYRKLLVYENSKVARKNLASVYESLGKYKAAAKEYEQLLKDENSSQLRLDLAIAYYNLDQLNKSERELKILRDSELEGDYIIRDVNYYLSLIANKSSNYEQAEEYIRLALADNNFALGYYQLGEVKYNQGVYKEAIDYYLKALKVDGSLKGVNRKIALAYLELDQSKAAVVYLKRANKENKEDRVIANKLAELKLSHPEYFEDKELTLPEERKREIPDSVTFEEVEAIKDPGRELRIGILDNEAEVYFRVGSDFKVKEEDKVILEAKKSDLLKAVFEEGRYYLEIGEKKIEFSNTIQVIPNNYAPVLVHNIIYGRGYYWGGIEDRQYRGSLELIPRKQGITVVNLVHMEEYLMGVIPSEMSPSWPIESLKVQAVAARSYTLANLNKHSDDGYDLCSDVHCAAYRGIAREYPRSNQAVLDTAGEVMSYNGNPINAVYSANSGGHTENSEDVWKFKVGYLRGVSTEIKDSKFPLSPADLKEWLRDTPASYSNNLDFTKASYYRWQRNLSIEYLESSLGIKNIKEVLPTQRGESGSVRSLLVIGENEEKEFTYNLRSKFGGLRSNRFWIQPQYENGRLSSFLFYGSGWGHSVGMDQVAVAAMADMGSKYKDILNHFYTDIKIEDRY